MIYQGLVRRIYERNIYVPIMHLSMLSPREGGFDCEVCPQGGEFDMATILDNEEGLEIYLVSKAFPSPGSGEKALGTRLPKITPPSWKIPRRRSIELPAFVRGG